MNNAKKGFTLVELLVVIAILAILATVSVVGYTSFINRAHESNAQTEAHQIESTIESYTMTGEYYILTEGQETNYLVTKDMLVYTYTVVDGVVTPAAQKSGAVTTDLGELNDDFKGLPGTLTVDANGNLVYKGANMTEGIVIK